MKPSQRPAKLSAGRPAAPLLHVLQVPGNAIIGGMETYVANLSRVLPSHGVRVSVLAPYESPYTRRLRALGCQVFVTQMDDTPSWHAIEFAAELARSLEVDLLHAHLPRAHLLAALAGRLVNRPVLATIHGLSLTAQEISLARLSGSHLAVVCQQALLNAIAGGVPLEQVSLIPNGVDIEIYRPGGSLPAVPAVDLASAAAAGRAAAAPSAEAGPGGPGSGTVLDRPAALPTGMEPLLQPSAGLPPPEPALEYRRMLGVPADAPLVGYVGRIDFEKGPDLFVLLAAHVLQECPSVHFVMVGDGHLMDEIHRQVHNLQMDAVFHFAGLSQRPWEVYPALDLVVQTSRVEGMPFALLEAMACGRAVAAFGVGGVPEVIEAGSTGLLAAPGDWKGLGGGVAALLRDRPRLDEMGRAARLRVEENFNLHDHVRQVAALYRRLAALGAGASPASSGSGLRLDAPAAQKFFEEVQHDPRSQNQLGDHPRP
ncbi:MAG: glycosyltransferase family 4 protein [Chloroflexota bacterium]